MYPHFSRKKELLLLCYSSHFTVKINISMSSFFYLFFQVEQSALSEEDSNLLQKLADLRLEKDNQRQYAPLHHPA